MPRPVSAITASCDVWHRPMDLLFESLRRSLHRLQIALGIAHVLDELLSFLASQLPETVAQPVDARQVPASLENDSHAIEAGLLRLDRERLGEESEYQNAGERGPKRRHPTPQSRRSRLLIEITASFP